jgi:hypothetical protein
VVLSRREGLLIYWCEGDKSTKRNYKVAVTSTNTNILRSFVDWLTKYYSVERDVIKLRLHIWKDIDEDAAKKHWSMELNIPISNFTKSYIKPKGGRKKIHYNGVCRASIQSKEIQTKIMEDIKKEFYIFEEPTF